MNIKDKAKRLNFSNLPPLSPSPTISKKSLESTPRPKTAPGAMMAFANDQRSALLKENEALRLQANQASELQSKLDEAHADLQQWDGAIPGLHLDPAKICRSRWANRHIDTFSNASFADLKQEIAAAGGNVQPIKVRRISENNFDYEIVFGHRRHQACFELGLPVFAIIENLSDTDLFVEMDRENRARKDLAPWEQGMMYRRALDEKLFFSNRKLADAIGADLSAVGKALVLAKLPEEVIAAFPSPLDLQYRWAKPLSDALTADRKGVLAKAKKISETAKEKSAKSVFAELTQSKQEGMEPFHSPKKQNIDLKGVTVGSLQMDKQGRVSMVFEPDVLPAQRFKELTKLIEKFLTK
jgi:ParB family chromosome partitioning protein